MKKLIMLVSLGLLSCGLLSCAPCLFKNSGSWNILEISGKEPICLFWFKEMMPPTKDPEWWYLYKDFYEPDELREFIEALGKSDTEGGNLNIKPQSSDKLWVFFLNRMGPKIEVIKINFYLDNTGQELVWWSIGQIDKVGRSKTLYRILTEREVRKNYYGEIPKKMGG